MSIYIGIDGGGTGTTALAVDDKGATRACMTTGPSNIRLLDDRALLARFKEIKKALPAPTSLAVGLAGLRTETDRARAMAIVAKVWPSVPFHITHDLEIALAASDSTGDARVLLLSGTGSCTFGQRRGGQSVKRGGWGHLLGDRGSGYDISLRALKELIRAFDETGKWPDFGASVLTHLSLNEPDDLIAWIQTAEKAEVAELAPVVFEAARSRSAIARLAIQGAAEDLAKIGAATAKALRAQSVAFVFAGSVFQRQPSFVDQCRRILKSTFPKAEFETLAHPPAVGACRMSAALLEPTGPRLQIAEAHPLAREYSPVQSLKQSPTERRNPRSMRFSEMSTAEAIELMLSEESKVPRALLRQKAQLESATELIVRALRTGGRLFYVGAGTSGRLGALDASECPPTFRSDPSSVQAIMAGGQRAFWRAVEGAEDDFEGGGRAMTYRGVNKGDVVVGIAASGRTPFVWGALREAKRRGAITVFLCFNPWLEIPDELRPNVLIAADLGGEVLTGSTRLKAGTATKLALNVFTTVAMTRLGKVASNLMIDLNPSNIKLRDRAVRIVRELTGAGADEASGALERSGWRVKQAIEALKNR